MHKAVLVVLTDPVHPDRDEEFNEWYDSTHLAEVLEIPGLTAATRYRVSDAQVKGQSPTHQYLAIYAIEADDPGYVLKSLMKGVGTMVLSDSLDVTTPSVLLYEQIAGRTTGEGQTTP